MNRKYEVLLLLKPNLGKEDLIKLINLIEAKLGGKIIKKEEWGQKKLAYEIKKFKEAIYVLYYVETTFENIAALKSVIAVNKDILRPMILRHERKWPFEYKTAKELKFPERKPRRVFSNDKFKKNTTPLNDKNLDQKDPKVTSEEKNDK